MRPLDTSEEAARIHHAILDRLGPEGRFELAIRLSRLAHEFARAGVRARHPGLTEAEVNRQLVRELYGV